MYVSTSKKKGLNTSLMINALFCNTRVPSSRPMRALGLRTVSESKLDCFLVVILRSTYCYDEGFLPPARRRVNTAAPEHHLRPICDQEFPIPSALFLSFLFLRQRLFFACISLHIPVLPFPPSLPSIPLTSQLLCAALPVPKFSRACSLEVPSSTNFFSHLSSFSSYISFSRTFLRSRTSPACSALPFLKSS